MRVLDSHLHLWDPGRLRYAWLRGGLIRRFGPDELREATGRGPGETRAFLFVEADCDPADSLDEVDWVCGIAAEAGVRGVVASLAVEDAPALPRRIEELRERALVVGVRRILENEASGFATSEDFVSGAREVARAGLTFDACIGPHRLPEVARLCDAVPGLTVVLDHLGKPELSSGPAGRWRVALRELAQRAGVVCKLSGLPAQAGAGWRAAELVPFLDAALEAFGPERLLFGSDWPVSSPYGAWEECVREWVVRAAPEHADAILWGNAVRVYGLGEPG